MIVEFFLIWLLASFQFGPNALNCFLAGITGRFWAIASAIIGILIVSGIITELFLISKNTVYANLGEYIYILKWIGAGWISYLGLKKYIDNEVLAVGNIDLKNEMPTEIVRETLNAVIISITNPKIIVFYISILTQYVEPDSSFVSNQIMPFLIFSAIVIAYGTYALIGFYLGNLLRSSKREISVGRISGISYVGIGLYLILFME